jgi:hypothetical protein
MPKFKKTRGAFAKGFMAKSPFNTHYSSPGDSNDIGTPGYGWEDKMYDQQKKDEAEAESDEESPNKQIFRTGGPNRKGAPRSYWFEGRNGKNKNKNKNKNNRGDGKTRYTSIRHLSGEYRED